VTALAVTLIERDGNSAFATDPFDPSLEFIPCHEEVSHIYVRAPRAPDKPANAASLSNAGFSI